MMVPFRWMLLKTLCLGLAALSVGLGDTAAKSFQAESFGGAVPSLPSAPIEQRILLAQNAPAPNSIPNAANVSVQMIPEQPVAVGTKVSFRVTARKSGYLMLVDIDASGKMSQIFPSPELLTQPGEKDVNFIKSGNELLIPSSAARKRGFEFVITPPTGAAAIVAILSEKRVQILDLPDMAQKPNTDMDALHYLAEWTNELRVPDSNSGKLLPNSWSFDVKSYSIQ
jgi:uncharacterized protein DUF4384